MEILGFRTFKKKGIYNQAKHFVIQAHSVCIESAIETVYARGQYGCQDTRPHTATPTTKGLYRYTYYSISQNNYYY